MQDQHIVSSFDQELDALNQAIARLGGLAEQQLAATITATESRETSALSTIIEKDQQLDQLEFEINEKAIEIIATRGPMATDLRRIISALKIAAVLERVGDLSKNIAKRTLVIIEKDAENNSDVSIRRIAETVQQMLHQVLDAYATGDAKLAMDVWDRDLEVDQMHNSLFGELLENIAQQKASPIVSSHYLFIAKNLERIGDHTTNIAEQVYYLVHGAFPTDERPKADLAQSPDID